MNRRPVSWLAAALLVGGAAPSQAHHSFAAEFDPNTRAELAGEVTGVWFNNPHVRFRIDAEQPDGSTLPWELQASSVTSLQQQGWRPDTLKVGDRIKVSGQLGRNGAKKLYLRSMERSDGTQLLGARDDRRAPDPNAVNADPNKDYGYGSIRHDYPLDITGRWQNRYKFRVTVDDLEPKPTPFTAEGRRIFEATDHYQDPALRCLALGLPRLFGSPYNMEIIDAGTHYVFIYVEHNTPRRIWMDGREPPSSTSATPLGFSVGRWDGDALVIETTHLASGWLDGSGLPMSGDGTRVVERWEPSADRITIDRTMTIHDPLYTAPLVRKRGSARGEDVDIGEQTPCDPDGYYRDLRELGRLDEHLDR
jgi:Family of unknown function (DUF6152)